MAGLPSLLQAFFTDRLLRQQRASPNTVAGYRDSFRMLFQLQKNGSVKHPRISRSRNLNVSCIGDFLDHLENRRKNSARAQLSRNRPMCCFASESSRCLPNATNGGLSNL